jgi:2-oxo-4-hydroxy-4-carboxy-5-ureidoimidazoline decarboxylase
VSKGVWFMQLEQLNDLGERAFTDAIGWAFEHSPWVAARAWNRRPFGSLDDLCDHMNRIVQIAPRAEQLTLLRAHPDLGTRAKVSPSSEHEQAGAGLDRLTPQEFVTLLHLNSAYKDKFGFPFLYAVKGSSKSDILHALEERLARTPDEEFHTALQQVYRIARFRLENFIK